MLIDPYDKDSDFTKTYGKDMKNAPISLNLQTVTSTKLRSIA